MWRAALASYYDGRARAAIVRVLTGGMPWPGLASQFFVSCFFLDSSGCAWNSSIFRLGSRMYNGRTAGKPADRSRVLADKLESRA